MYPLMILIFSLSPHTLHPDHTGVTFWDGLEQRELQMLWSLSIEWFNPQDNKAVRKSTSTGLIAMACLNLSLSLHCESENLFLVGVRDRYA